VDKRYRAGGDVGFSLGLLTRSCRKSIRVI
jgi:hypothetical protein